jgi:MFS family permease
MKDLFIISASVTIMTNGLEVGWISPTTKILQSEQSPTGYPLSDQEMMWLGSLFPLMAAVGVFIYIYLANTYGRKYTVIAIAVPQMVSSWILCKPGTLISSVPSIYSSSSSAHYSPLLDIGLSNSSLHLA